MRKLENSRHYFRVLQFAMKNEGGNQLSEVATGCVTTNEEYTIALLLFVASLYGDIREEIRNIKRESKRDNSKQRSRCCVTRNIIKNIYMYGYRAGLAYTPFPSVWDPAQCEIGFVRPFRSSRVRSLLQRLLR